MDPENRDAIERTIGDINDNKKISVILTTHNVVQATKLSNQTISLFEGKLVTSSYENIFSGKVVENENEGKHCIIHEDINFSVDTEKTGNVRVLINPSKIRLLTNRTTPVKKDTIRGRIIQLTEVPDGIRATVDAGVQVHALLSRYEVQKRSLYIGDDVGILFPMEAVLIL